MKAFILLLIYSCPLVSSFAICPRPIANAERDTAAPYPNDNVVLTADGQNFIPYKYVPGQTCAAYTCGRKTFPHGFNIEIISHTPLMLCEEHRCLNPEKIECRKAKKYGACLGEKEWVAGLIERKNETKEWLEVECCQYKDNIKPAFIKHVVISSQYNHDIVLENGKMIASDYTKDISSCFVIV